MARKSKSKEVEEKVVPLEAEDVKAEPETIEPEKKTSKSIIAKSFTVFRKKASIEQKYVAGEMPIGVAYEIVKEVKSIIFGSFYLLDNGYYITKDGNYTIY